MEALKKNKSSQDNWLQQTLGASYSMIVFAEVSLSNGKK